MSQIVSVPKTGSMSQHRNLEMLYEDADLRVTAIVGEGDFCIVTCIGVGLADGGIDIQSEEFKKINPGFGTQIFVFDKKRSWGNSIDFDKITKLVTPFCENRRIVTMGLSMGGFLAIVLTRYLGAETCIAFTPQYSMDPAIVPSERRWAAYTRNITEWKISSLDGYINDKCDYFIFFTADPEERLHLSMFPELDNLAIHILPRGGHNVGRFMKEVGILYDSIERCLHEDTNGVMPLPLKAYSPA